METKDYLKIIHEEIHSTVVATVDKNGYPVTRVIDMMLHDDDSLYFLTAKGKVFYEQLMQQKYIALSGMTGGEGSMKKKAISVRGKVKNIGTGKLDEINTPANLIEQLGSYAVDISDPSGIKSSFYSTKQEAIEYLSSLSAEASLRRTTLEDVFIEHAGRRQGEH